MLQCKTVPKFFVSRIPLSPNNFGGSDTIIYTVAGSQMFRESADPAAGKSQMVRTGQCTH